MVNASQPLLGCLPSQAAPSKPALSAGLLQMQLILHYDETYREVKYGNMGLPDIDSKMLIGINVMPIAALLYTPVLIRCDTEVPTRAGLSPRSCEGVQGLLDHRVSSYLGGLGRQGAGRGLAYLEG